VKIDPSKKQATFEKLNSPGETLVQKVCSICDEKGLNIITDKFSIFVIMLVFSPPCDASNGTACSFEGTSNAD